MVLPEASGATSALPAYKPAGADGDFSLTSRSGGVSPTAKTEKRMDDEQNTEDGWGSGLIEWSQHRSSGSCWCFCISFTVIWGPCGFSGAPPKWKDEGLRRSSRTREEPQEP